MSLFTLLAPLNHRALDHRRDNAAARLERIHVECSPCVVPLHMKWSAIDTDTYDADCDQDGYFSRSPVGYGATREAAIEELLDQLEAAS